MRRPLVLLAAVFATVGTARSAVAQPYRVAGTLYEAGSERVVPGAAVYLLNDNATAVAVTLSQTEGSFRLRAPEVGSYRLRVERIGFDTEVSALFDVGPDGVDGLAMALPVRPIELAPLAVEAQRVCSIDDEATDALTRVWWEARKALFATVLSSESEQVYVVEVVERELSRDLEVREEIADTSSVIGGHVFGFVPEEELRESGWGSVEDGEVTRYFGPSPELLLSPWFGSTHCFGQAEDPGGRIGLRFESIPDSLEIGMRGVFWLDPDSWRLSEIEFSYTGSRDLERARHQGGSIQLDMGEGGGWFVSQWYVRRPIMRRGPLVWSPSGARSRTAARSYTVAGYVERAGRVLPSGGAEPR